MFGARICKHVVSLGIDFAILYFQVGQYDK